MKILMVAMIGSIIFTNLSDAGIGMGKGGPNMYAKRLLVELDEIAGNLTALIKERQLINHPLSEMMIKKFENDLEQACVGKCSEADIEVLKTIQEDKENIRILRDRIEIQIREVLQKLRNEHIGESLFLLDKINQKLADMKRD